MFGLLLGPLGDLLLDDSWVDSIVFENLTDRQVGKDSHREYDLEHDFVRQIAATLSDSSCRHESLLDSFR